MAIEDHLSQLEARVSKLENRKRDLWDKVQILGALLIPAAITVIGLLYTASVKETELNVQALREAADQEAARIRDGHEYEIARKRSQVEQASLAVSLFGALLSKDGKRQRLAMETLIHGAPDAGFALIRTVSEETPSAAGRGLLADALHARQLALIAQLFSDLPAQRRDAYTSLVNEWSNDSGIVPEVLSFARDHLENENGIYNSLVFLSHMKSEALRPNVSAIESFCKEVENIGPRIRQRVETLRSRLPAPK